MIYYYVNSTTGVDEVGAGTRDKPFKTLDYAINNTINATEGDITYYLLDGIYEYASTKLDTAQKGRKFYLIGKGKGVKIIYGDPTPGTRIGTVGVDIYFKKLAYQLVGGTNPYTRNNNLHFENVLFLDVPTAIYGCILPHNPGSTMKNCVQNNTTAFIRNRGNFEITGCYGGFGEVYTSGSVIDKVSNKILTDDSEIQLNEKYKITDPSVDNSKIGLYSGEYAWLEQDCLIKLNDKYYSILEEFWDKETKQFNEVGSLDFEKSFLLPDLTKQVTYGDDTFVPIDKFDNFSIVFKDENIKKLNINGYKIPNKTVITNPIDLRMVENFNNLYINGSNVKCLIKFNEEEVFYKYNFETNTLETKEIDNILTNGIDISQVKDIDFNTIKEKLEELKNITFAFYLEQDSVVNNIVIDYLEVGEFSQKTSTQTKLKVGYKKITIQPTFSTNLLKINVL